MTERELRVATTEMIHSISGGQLSQKSLDEEDQEQRGCEDEEMHCKLAEGGKGKDGLERSAGGS